MKAYVLILETVLRKRTLSVIHASWLLLYAALFLIPFPEEGGWNWGPFLFAWSGCLLPLLLSAGIFGDDIASGRISLLVTKPIRTAELYCYRLLGLSVQGTIHLAAASIVIMVLHRLTGRGGAEHFATWALGAWLVFQAWAALSTSLSVVVRREHNSILLFVVALMAACGAATLNAILPEALCTKVFVGVLRYAGPPVEFLSKMATGQFDSLRSLGSAAHSLTLTVAYGAIGIFILGRREFKRTED